MVNDGCGHCCVLSFVLSAWYLLLCTLCLGFLLDHKGFSSRSTSYKAPSTNPKHKVAISRTKTKLSDYYFEKRTKFKRVAANYREKVELSLHLQP
jgi:hypothetical protein